jgi:tellurium resistance protein TerD
MAISLKKGGSFNLSKNEPSLEKIMVGLGWEMKSSAKLDLDVSVFMLGANGKIPTEEYFVFYNNLKSPDGAVQHTGDNRSGDEEGDDEMILANLPLVDKNIKELLFAVSIHEAEARRHSFNLLQNAYIRVVDVANNREILRYDLDQDFSSSTDMEFGRLVRENGDWSFHASGLGSNRGLQGFVDMYA